MSDPTAVLFVKFKTSLTLDEVRQVADSRIEQFRALGALQQKYYLHDAQTGEFAGLYLWESREALIDYRNSELSRSIAAAYKTEGAPRVEVFEIIEALRTGATG
jgi:heme-degrading monooxygenase HmoA